MRTTLRCVYSVMLSMILVLGNASAFPPDDESVLIENAAGQRNLLFGVNILGLDARNELHMWNPITGEQKRIYKNDVVADFAVSSTNVIAVACWAPEETTADVVDVGKSTLKILSSSGEIVESLELEAKVRSLSWSPNGCQLAYVTASTRAESGEYRYVDAHTFIYSTASKVIKKIFDGGYKVRWPDFDNNIYILDKSAFGSRVYVYNISDGEAKPTQYKSIRFSPQGTYYFDLWNEPPGFYVQRRDSDEATLASISERALQNLMPMKWMNEEWIICSGIDYSKGILEQPTYLVNVLTGDVLKSKKYIVSNYSSEEVIVVAPDKSLSLENISKMKKAELCDIPLAPGS